MPTDPRGLRADAPLLDAWLRFREHPPTPFTIPNFSCTRNSPSITGIRQYRSPAITLLLWNPSPKKRSAEPTMKKRKIRRRKRCGQVRNLWEGQGSAPSHQPCSAFHRLRSCPQLHKALATSKYGQTHGNEVDTVIEKTMLNINGWPQHRLESAREASPRTAAAVGPGYAWRLAPWFGSQAHPSRQARLRSSHQAADGKEDDAGTRYAALRRRLAVAPASDPQASHRHHRCDPKDHRLSAEPQPPSWL